MHDFLLALLGGLCLGLATVGYLYSTGRVVGISGMLAGSLFRPAFLPAVMFLLGIIMSAMIAQWTNFIDLKPIAMPNNPAWLIGSGLLVGLGTTLGSGCTSGHGVCGLARLSVRSLVATCTFMTAGVMTVLAVRLMGVW